MIDLLEVTSAFSPRLMRTGQIRLNCCFRDKHAPLGSPGGGNHSLWLTPHLNVYFCFSCKSKGPLVSLLQKQFGVDFFDALEAVTLGDYAPEKKEFELDFIWDLDPPAHFVEKGYPKALLRKFRVGTSRGKIVIPCYQGRELKGVQFRIYGEKLEDRKFWFSEGFDKEHYVYNLDYSHSYAVLTEGPSDVWRVEAHGYHSISTLSAAVSDAQAQLIGRYPKVYLALDNDPAGMKATELAYHKLKDHTDVLFVPYAAEDPGKSTKRDFMRAMRQAADYGVYSLKMTELLGEEYLLLQAAVKKSLLKKWGLK